MSKYIDADKLKAEINRRILQEQGFEDGDAECGYKCAFALTWEDVAILITIYEQGVDNGDYRRYNEVEWMKEYSQDILRRFNEIRKK